jgi:hypothetical protein
VRIEAEIHTDAQMTSRRTRLKWKKLSVQSGDPGREPNVGDLKEGLLALEQFQGQCIKYVRSLNKFFAIKIAKLKLGMRKKHDGDKLKKKRMYCVKIVKHHHNCGKGRKGQKLVQEQVGENENRAGL